jgi:DNA-binding transcriptional MerR regulator
MLTIGEYSRLTHVPSKTLRYYDEIGLFTPQEIDPMTSYRYYSVEQLPLLYRILSLKELGLTLKQIHDVLNETISPEELRGMLRLKEAQLKDTIEAEQRRLVYVANKIEQLEATHVFSQYDVILKTVPKMQVAMVREIIPEKARLKEALGMMFNTVHAFLQERKIVPVGHGFNIYFDEEYRDTQMDIGAAFPMCAEVSGEQDVIVCTLAAETMASVIHHGALEKMENTYMALLAWIDGNGYRIKGASREIALHYDPFGKPQDFVTEIQFPVHKA